MIRFVLSVISVNLYNDQTRCFVDRMGKYFSSLLSGLLSGIGRSGLLALDEWHCITNHAHRATEHTWNQRLGCISMVSGDYAKPFVAVFNLLGGAHQLQVVPGSQYGTDDTLEAIQTQP
jgi:hypothetical protein